MVFKFATILIASLCTLEQVELVPVDAGVEDRGALSTSLFVEPKDLRQNQSFERLYKVEGSDDVYVRKAGGLKAIFRSSHWRNSARTCVTDEWTEPKHRRICSRGGTTSTTKTANTCSCWRSFITIC